MEPTSFDAAPKPGASFVWGSDAAAPRSITLEVVAIDPGLEVIRTFSFQAIDPSTTTVEAVKVSCAARAHAPGSRHP